MLHSRTFHNMMRSRTFDSHLEFDRDVQLTWTRNHEVYILPRRNLKRFSLDLSNSEMKEARGVVSYFDICINKVQVQIQIHWSILPPELSFCRCKIIRLKLWNHTMELTWTCNHKVYVLPRRNLKWFSLDLSNSEKKEARCSQRHSNICINNAQV